jgi:hypothetical protein
MLTDVKTYVIRERLKAREIDASDAIVSDISLRCGDRLNVAESDEMRNTIIDDEIEQMPHLQQHIIVPDDVALDCFSAESKTHLASQGAAVKKYGKGAVEAVAARWKTKLGSTSPGINPKTPSKEALAKLTAKAKAADSESPSNNPWHPSYRTSGKTPEERERLRNEAKTKIIMTFGTKGAQRMAAAAGVGLLSGTPLKK